MNISVIIQAFDEEDTAGFMAELMPKTRSRRLFQVLRSNPGIDRSELFRRIFKTKRTVDNDHLLRNELSILKKKLESFITENPDADVCIDPAYKKEYLMSEWCIKKTLINQAKIYLEKAHVMALKRESFEDLLKLNRLRLQITQFGKSDYQNKLDEMAILRSDHLKYLKEFVSTELKYADFINAGAFKLAVNLRIHTSPFEPIEKWEVDTREANNSMAMYYHYKSLAYSNSGLKAIRFLEQALEVLNSSDHISQSEAEKLTCYAAMAMEYSLAGDFDKSAEVYEFIFSLPGSDHFASRNALLYNYCTTLLKNGEYTKALKYIEYLERSKPEPVVAERIYTMKCNCYIFLEDVKMIRKILPDDLQHYDVTLRTYYRFLYTIYYLIKGDRGMAERELTNISAMKDFRSTGYMPLLQLFERYIHVLDSILYKEGDPKMKLNTLHKHLAIFNEQNEGLAGLLPATWITRKINDL